MIDNPFPTNTNLEQLFSPLKTKKSKMKDTPEYKHFYAIRLVLQNPKDTVSSWNDAAIELKIPLAELKSQFKRQINSLNKTKSKIHRSFEIRSFEPNKPFIIVGLSAEDAMETRSIINTIGRLSVALYHDCEWKKLSKNKRLFNAETIVIPQQNQA
jgi:hypothetical protein